MSRLSHIGDDGRATMVDISEKDISSRRAVAEGLLRVSPETLSLAISGQSKKGAVIPVAELAGIMGAKKTSELIPLCHPLPLSKIGVDITARDGALVVTSEARTTGRTGVEMEALTAATIALLTLYDMLKAAQKDMVIEEVRLIEKTGGAGGDYKTLAPS